LKQCLAIQFSNWHLTDVVNAGIDIQND